MKRITKIKTFVVCAVLFLLSFAALVGVSFSGVKASGDAYFEMVNGTSVKISDEGGLRFRVKMDGNAKAIIDAEGNGMHFIVAPKILMNAVTDGNYKDMEQKIVIDVDKESIYFEDEYYYANAIIQNIKESNRQLDFCAIAYIEVNGGSDIYATADGISVGESGFSLNNVRGNIYDIVNQAFLDEYTDDINGCSAYNTWYSTDKYPVQIKTVENYNSLVSKINVGKEFGGKTIVMTEAVNSATEKAEVEDGKHYRPFPFPTPKRLRRRA